MNEHLFPSVGRKTGTFQITLKKISIMLHSNMLLSNIACFKFFGTIETMILKKGIVFIFNPFWKFERKTSNFYMLKM